MARRSLTGVKPTGAPHIGNLLGAIRPALALQDSYEAYYFVASYHALTTVQDRAALRAGILEVGATWLALGLDPSRTVVFNQHDVPELCELTWVLGCVLSKGMLDKGHAFKDAVAKGKDVNAGVFNYPLLMAADILMFQSDVVPVGKDQKQHVEIARDVAGSFNAVFGETFKLPEAIIQADVATIPGLDGRKMSKSYGNSIEVFLPTRQLRKKVMSIQTDSKTMEEPKDPDTCNVFNLYKLFATPEQTADLAARYRAGGLGYGHAKQELFEVMDQQLEAPRARYEELKARPEQVFETFSAGAERARAVARSTMSLVRDRIGL